MGGAPRFVLVGEDMTEVGLERCPTFFDQLGEGKKREIKGGRDGRRDDGELDGFFLLLPPQALADLDVVYASPQTPTMLPWQALTLYVPPCFALELLSEGLEVRVPSPDVPRPDGCRDVNPVDGVRFRVRTSLVAWNCDGLDRHPAKASES